MGFQDSSWNISVSGWVILPALFVEMLCRKADRDTQTNAGKNPTPPPATAVGVGNNTQ